MRFERCQPAPRWQGGCREPQPGDVDGHRPVNQNLVLDAPRRLAMSESALASTAMKEQASADHEWERFIGDLAACLADAGGGSNEKRHENCRVAPRSVEHRRWHRGHRFPRWRDDASPIVLRDAWPILYGRRCSLRHGT